MLSSLLMIFACLVILVIYLYIGLITIGNFWWCFGIPYINTFKRKLLASLIQFMLLTCWPVFYLGYGIFLLCLFIEMKRKR